MDLKVVYATLAEVASLEERLAAARDARERHARRDDHLGALGRELAVDAQVASQAVAEANAALRRLDRELRDVETKLAEHERRLAQVADVRQAAAVRLEAASLARRREALEAEALGLLGALEVAEAGVGEAVADVDRQAARSRTELEALERAADRGAATIAAGQEELARLVSLLPADLGRHLRRLQERGLQSVVVLKGGACGGCFAQLPAASAGELRGRRAVIRCGGCGRVVIET
ncbi:MAG: hypothetical protein IPK64_07385 [bacterium]|nr:hypothetical protein [bacterium]